VEAMSSRKNEDALSMLADDFFADLLTLSEAEVLSEAEEDYGSVKAALGDVRAEIEVAIQSIAKDQLSEARAAIDRHRESSLARAANDVSKLRELLDKILSTDPNRARLTLAARKGKPSFEREFVSALFDLCRLQVASPASVRPNFGRAAKAKQILTTLGVTEPHEIDVEAIAWCLGAEVRYDDLEECEARIVGTDDAAIITVNKTASPQRQRFSICHELGHWIYHRRRVLLCDGNEIERPSFGALSMERAADRFASELLMPDYLFVPIAENLGRPSMQVVRKLSEIFNTSHTAAAIRLVEISQLPVLLTCHERSGRSWFTKSQSIPADWMPSAELNPESGAFTMIFGKAPRSMPAKSVSASNWFGRRDASRYEIIEESVRISRTRVLTLLAFKDARRFLQERG
jgi:hypothetical protein